MLPADLQVELLLAKTAPSPPPPLYPPPGGAGAPVVSRAWDPTRSAFVGSSLFPGAPSPAIPPPRAQPHARAPLPLSLSPSLHPHARRNLYVPRADNLVRVRRYFASRLLPWDMTDTFNVRQRALSQPLSVEVVGGKRPRPATRLPASQPETRRPGTKSRTFVSTHTRLESLFEKMKFF